MSQEKISITRAPYEEKDRSVYEIENLLDEQAIKRGLRIAKKTDSLPSFKLSRVEYHPSGYCNLGCGGCYGKELAPTTRESIPPRLFAESLLDIKETMQESPLIILSGLYTEPTAHSKFIEMMNHLAEMRFRFGVYTNGLLLKPDSIDAIAQASRATGASLPCYVSFNIAAALERDIFRKELIPKIRHISEIRGENKKDLQINASLTVFKIIASYDLLKGTIDELLNSGVDNIRLSTPWPVLKIGERTDHPISKRILDLMCILQIESPGRVKVRTDGDYGEFQRCYASTSGLTISPECDVFPCPEVASPIYREEFSLGNIKTTPLSQIWQSRKHLYFYQQFNPARASCSCCPFDRRFNTLCEKLNKE